MKAYLKNGKTIRITQSVANKIWEAMTEYDNEKPTRIRVKNSNNGDTLFVIDVNDISCVK